VRGLGGAWAEWIYKCTDYALLTPNPLAPVNSSLSIYIYTRRLRLLGWAPSRRQQQDATPLLLCASSTTEVSLFVVATTAATGAVADRTLKPTRLLSFASPVDGWTWVAAERDEDMVLLVMSGGQVHRYAVAELLLAPEEQGGEEPEAKAEGSELLEPLSVRGRCIGVVEGGSERLLVVATGQEGGLEQQLRRRQPVDREEAIVNTTLLELRRTQRRPPGTRGVQQQQQQQEEEEQEEEEDSTAQCDLLAPVKGAMSSLLSVSSSSSAAAAAIPPGLLLHRIHDDQRPSLSSPPPPQHQHPGALLLTRIPTRSAPLSACLESGRLLASVPLPEDASMMATSGQYVVVGGRHSATLHPFMLSTQGGGTLDALTPLAMPEGFRPRGLAIHERRAFCFATRRYEKEEERQWKLGAGDGLYKAVLFVFELAAPPPQSAQQQEEEEEEAERGLAAAKQQQESAAGGNDDAVMAFLRQFRGEVLGRLDALEGRLGQLEATAQRLGKGGKKK
jgi:hypothetical protein